MGLFGFAGGSSNTLGEVFRKQFYGQDRDCSVSMGKLIKILNHYVSIRKLLRQFYQKFQEGNTLLQEDTRFKDTTKLFNDIKNSYVQGVTLEKFVDSNNMNDDNEELITIYTIRTLLDNQNFRNVYDAVYCFVKKFEESKSLYDDYAQTDNETDVTRRYKSIWEIYNTLVGFTLDTRQDADFEYS